MAFEVTREMVDGLASTGPTDPIRYYRRPLVGWLFRERINRGLRLLPRRRFAKGLEIGYGAGAVLIAMGGGVDELHGVELNADEGSVALRLAARGCTPVLKRGRADDLPYEAETFDLVLCFSVFEHLLEHEAALHEVARVLRSRGLFLLGMPAVNRVMDLGFRAIGFKGIEDHHVTTPAAVAAHFADVGFRIEGSGHLGLRPLFPPMYFTWLLSKEERARPLALRRSLGELRPTPLRHGPRLK